MIDIAPNYFETVKRILAAHVPDCEVRAFGSRFKWTAKDYSDLDLVVVGTEKLGFKRLGELREAFEESDLPYRVDVLDYNDISENFKKVINKGYETIFTPNTKMKNKDWKKVRLGDAPLEIIDGDRGKNYPSQNEFSQKDYCLFLSTKNVRLYGFDFTECQFISKEKDALLRKGKLSKNDIVLTTRGTVGNIAFYDNNVPFDVVRINSGMVIIRPDSSELFPKFCFYLFRKLQDDFRTFTTGSAQPQLPIKDLNKMTITLPPLPVQRRIAAVLSSLDDKIELNRKMNANLEQIAQAIFKNWFVDFEPFKNGEFVESELGMIPKEWKVVFLGEVMEFKNGKKRPMNLGNFPVYGGNGIFSSSDMYNAENVVIIGRVGAYCGSLFFENEKCWISDNAISGKSNISENQYYFYQLMLQQNLNMMNIGTSQPLLTQNILSRIKCILPCTSAIEKYNSIAKTLFNQMQTLASQSISLAVIRDTLLPKLMDRELEVIL